MVTFRYSSTASRHPVAFRLVCFRSASFRFAWYCFVSFRFFFVLLLFVSFLFLFDLFAPVRFVFASSIVLQYSYYTLNDTNYADTNGGPTLSAAERRRALAVALFVSVMTLFSSTCITMTSQESLLAITAPRSTYNIGVQSSVRSLDHTLAWERRFVFSAANTPSIYWCVETLWIFCTIHTTVVGRSADRRMASRQPLHA